MRYLSHIALLLTITLCTPKAETAQSIIDKSILAHGGGLFESSVVEFDFRNRHYKLERDQGKYKYHRMFGDSLGDFHDILDNDGFTRTINNEPANVDEEWARRYSNSINSVAYFAYLPFGLNDPAVNKKLLKEETINSTEYFVIQVTFSQEGGGEDYEDVFVYWIDKQDFRLKYFGYSYLTDGGGIRFREAVSQREKNGLIFSDYINYKGQNDNRDVPGLAQLFAAGELEKLSEIRLENLNVRRSNSVN